MGESKPRSSSRLSADEYERRRKGGKSSSSSSNHHKSASSSNRHSPKSHGSSSRRSLGSESQSDQRRSSRREEDDQEVKRKVRESMRSSRSEQRAEEDREAERRTRDSTRSSTLSRRSSNHGTDGAQPGAYTSSIDMAGRKSSRSSSQQLKLPRNESSIDSLLDDDDEDNTHFLSAQEIDDQRTKLSARSSSTGTPGALPEKVGERPSKTGGRPSAKHAESEKKHTVGKSSHYRQSHHRVNADPTDPVDPKDNGGSSSAAPVEAMAVQDTMQDDRVVSLEEANRQLQQEMEELRRGATTIVQAEEAKPSSSSKRTWILVAIFVLLAVAAGGAVAGVMIGKGGNEEGGDGPVVAAENPSGPLGPTGSVTSVPNVAPTHILITNAPTRLPSQSPSEALPFDPPSESDCLAMSKGEAVLNQSSLFDKNFTIGLDVSLILETNALEMEPILSESIQEHLVPQLAGCPSASRRRLSTIRRRLSDNYVIGNAIANAVCDTEATCNTLDSEVCYQCLVNLQLFLKDNVTGVILLLSEVVQQDLVDLLDLRPPFIEVKAVSVLGVDPTPAPSSAPSITPSIAPSMMPSLRPSASPSNAPTSKVTASPTKNPTPNPTPEPTPRPTPPPTPGPTPNPTPQPTPAPVSAPTKAPIQPTPAPSPEPTPAPVLQPTQAPDPSPSTCPDWTAYFEGPVKTDTLEEDEEYEIGCGGSPETLVVLAADGDNCVRCLGFLEATDYGGQCTAVNCMLFQIPEATSTGEAIYFGYASLLSYEQILDGCTDLTLVENDGSLCFTGGGGDLLGPGGGGPRHSRMV